MDSWASLFSPDQLIAGVAPGAVTGNDIWNPQLVPQAPPGFYGGSPETNPSLAPQGAASLSQGGSSLANALRGMTMPKPPEAQKVSTPYAPRPSTAIKPGELLALIEMMNAGNATGGLKLPSTLGAAIGGR